MKIIENRLFKEKEIIKMIVQINNHWEIYGYVERAFTGCSLGIKFGSTELEGGGIDGGTDTPPTEVKTY